jgi:hypothetical protein
MSHTPSDVFKEYKDQEQSLPYPSERLVATVSASVTVLDGMIAEVAQTHLIEEKIITAINNTIDFGWIWSSGCLLHNQEIVDGISSSVVQAKKQITDGSKQTEGYEKEVKNSVAYMSQ